MRVGGVRRSGSLLLATLLIPFSMSSAAESLLRPGIQPTALDPSRQLGFREWFGRPAFEQKREWQRTKNPTVAMVSSFLLPGLGQLYNEREFWAVVVAGIEFYFIGDIIIQQRLTNRYREIKNIPIPPECETPTEENAAACSALLQARQDAQVLFALHRDNRIQSTWLLGLTILLSGIQSFVDAHLFDFDVGKSLNLEPSLDSVHGGVLRLRF
ncbi:MAG: hypothetical protein JSW67_03615 [Candidatus Latescibacterota bacterium]|nr:MAG: hypothetical protein JSW67_03615 [Candidatus Latescibacterota bacterium]